MSTLDSLNNIRRYASCDSHGYMCESCPNDPEQVIKHAKLLMLELVGEDYVTTSYGASRELMHVANGEKAKLRKKIEAL